MLTGYHYTQFSKLDSIFCDGLVPQPVAADKVAAIEGVDAEVIWDRRGVWIWKQRLFGEAHAGSVVFQIAKSGETRVALLKVRYNESDFLRSTDGGEVVIGHRGTTGRWVYHNTQEHKARMLVRPIPADRVSLVGVYDLVEALQEPYVSATL